MCAFGVSGEKVTSDIYGDPGFTNLSKTTAGGSSCSIIGDSSCGDQKRMGGQTSKQSNLVVIENIQKALQNHEEEKRRMQLGPGGFPGGNVGKFMDGGDGKPGYAGVTFHVETFLLVLGACGMISVALYLLFRCARKGSCLPAYLRAAVEGNSAIKRRVRYYRPSSSPTEDFEIQMHPQLEMQKTRRGKYESEELGSGGSQHERIYPRIEPKEVNVMGGVGLG